jgi:AsmA-like C-terminal region
MSSPAIASAAPVKAAPGRLGASRWNWRWILAGIFAGMVLVVFLSIFSASAWPFSEHAVLQDLAEAADSSVTATRYHATYFPPGCILEGVEFRHQKFRLITIQKLIVKGSYLGILRRHISRVEAIRAHVFIPAFGSKLNLHTRHSTTVVDEFVANATDVEYDSNKPRQQPFFFDVHEATFKNLGWDHPIAYHLKLRNPNPPGEISADGKFGAWAEGHPEDTPFSGDYTFEDADLSVYGGIAGMLDSKGSFGGALKHLHVTGTTVVPDFEVQSSARRVKLETKFDAYVNALNGDTFLKRVEAHFGRTTVIAEGRVAHSAALPGHLTDLRFTARSGRIQDILGLFASDGSPMSGVISLQAEATISPGDEEFLKKIELKSVFGIGEGSFAKQQTQQGVDELSAGARGKDKDKEHPEMVLTDLSGQVRLADGLAQFTNLQFGIPGVRARMSGTYDILNYKINLHGRMRVETRIFKTTSGVKSLFLKFIDPIFKKKKGEVVPVHIEGTYQKPQFGLDLADKNAPKKLEKP